MTTAEISLLVGIALIVLLVAFLWFVGLVGLVAGEKTVTVRRRENERDAARKESTREADGS